MAIRRLGRYRTGKKAYKTLKYGLSPGSAQYLGRQVWYASRTAPGGNYANPKRRSS